MDRKALWLTLHLGWALAWGALISVVPLNLVAMTAVIWIPVFVFGEFLWIRKHGVKPALLSSLGLVSAVIFGVWILPKDRPIGNSEPLPGLTVTLDELREVDSRFRAPDALGTVSVRFPSRNPTLRQAVAAIESQTPFRCKLEYCTFGESVLTGPYVRSVRIVAATPPSAAVPAGAP